MKPDILLLQNPIPRIQYYIDHRNQREAQIVEMMKSNPNTWYSDMDLVRAIYTGTPEQLWRAAAHNVSQHLKKLKKQNIIESEESSNGEKWKYL